MSSLIINKMYNSKVNNDIIKNNKYFIYNYSLILLFINIIIH